MNVVLVFELACDVHWMKDVAQFPIALAHHFEGTAYLLVRPNHKQIELSKHIRLHFMGLENTENYNNFETYNFSSRVYSSYWYAKACIEASKIGDCLILYPFFGNPYLGAFLFKLFRWLKFRRALVFLKSDGTLIRATGKRPSIIRTIRDRIRYLFIDQIVCESFHIYSTLKSSKYRLIDKIVFVPNCPLPIYQNRTKLRDRPKNFLFVGRISDNEKGADILLENWLKVFRDLKGWRLLLAGPSDESFRTLWETKFEQNDAASSVKWENYVSPYELVEYYSNSRIVICTSRKESGPIILTESAMMGCAFIGSAVGEIPSILSDLPGLFRSDIELQMEIIKFANDSEIAQNQSDILYERVKDRVWSEQVKKIQNPWG